MYSFLLAECHLSGESKAFNSSTGEGPRESSLGKFEISVTQLLRSTALFCITYKIYLVASQLA